MKKFIGAAIAAGAVIGTAGAANAGEISANINLTTDYVFRGISLAGNDPAIQGGFDLNHQDMFYAGVWGSNVVEGLELDLYAGFTPTVGPFDLDIGLIGYFYPGADDDGAEFDYVEFLFGAETALTEQVTVGGAFYYTGSNFGDTGEATYWELNGAFAASEALEFSAAFGNQTIEEPNGPGTEDDYNTWNLGATLAHHGFTFDLRYHDTDIDAGSDIEAYSYGPSSYDSAIVFTIGREL